MIRTPIGFLLLIILPALLIIMLEIRNIIAQTEQIKAQDRLTLAKAGKQLTMRARRRNSLYSEAGTKKSLSNEIARQAPALAESAGRDDGLRQLRGTVTVRIMLWSVAG